MGCRNSKEFMPEVWLWPTLKRNIGVMECWNIGEGGFSHQFVFKG